MTPHTFAPWVPQTVVTPHAIPSVGPVPEAALFLDGLFSERAHLPFTPGKLNAFRNGFHDPEMPAADTYIAGTIEGPEGVLLGFADCSALLLRRAGNHLRLPATCLVGQRRPETWTPRALHDALQTPWSPLPRPKTTAAFRTAAPTGFEALLHDPAGSARTHDAFNRVQGLVLAMVRLWDQMPPTLEGVAFSLGFDGMVTASSMTGMPVSSDPSGTYADGIARACTVAHALFPGRMALRRRFVRFGSNWYVEPATFASVTRDETRVFATAHAKIKAATTLRTRWPEAADAVFS